MPIANLLAESCKRHPDRTALAFRDRRWSYRELDETTERLARSLAGTGVRPGDRVAFLLANCPELVWLYLACFKCGAVAVPLNVRLTGPELYYVLHHSGARLLVSHADLYPGLAPVRADLPEIGRCFVVGDPGQWPDLEPFDSLLRPQPQAAPWPEPRPDQPAAILYTSGTTARPKGVTHTQGSLAATVRFYLEASGLGASDALCGMLPMAHIFAASPCRCWPPCAPVRPWS
jgi:acyl-CoA synthetase (AMP-forming)/AMP-acid ligase II